MSMELLEDRKVKNFVSYIKEIRSGCQTCDSVLQITLFAGASTMFPFRLREIYSSY